MVVYQLWLPLFPSSRYPDKKSSKKSHIYTVAQPISIIQSRHIPGQEAGIFIVGHRTEAFPRNQEPWISKTAWESKNP